MLLLLLLVSLSLGDPRAEWEAWKERIGKSYSSPMEEEARFSIFQETLARVNGHNREAAHTWKRGLTKFADLTKEEFVATYASGLVTTRRGAGGPTGGPKLPARVVNQGALPDSVDWRDKGVVTSVRDQGFCGSCWAFASASTIASYAKINDKEDNDLEELSPQHLVSCAPNPLHCGGRGGCSGSVGQLAFTYASLFGIAKESDYPYTSGSSDGVWDEYNCTFGKNYPHIEAKAMTMGFQTLPRNDQEALMAHLANVGPVATSVAASEWGDYEGGIYDACPYDDTMTVNHLVQLVGYGSDPEGNYWLIKNSWGENWGEQGYMKLKREDTVSCGTDTSPNEGTYCEDSGVDSYEVCGMCAVLSDNSYPVGTYFTK